MEECTNRDLQERTLSMGMIFGLGALIMFGSFVWQVCMFTMLLSGIRKRSWMSVVIGGIIYTISVGVSLLCYELAEPVPLTTVDFQKILQFSLSLYWWDAI